MPKAEGNFTLTDQHDALWACESTLTSPVGHAFVVQVKLWEEALRCQVLSMQQVGRRTKTTIFKKTPDCVSSNVCGVSNEQKPCVAYPVERPAPPPGHTCTALLLCHNTLTGFVPKRSASPY